MIKILSFLWIFFPVSCKEIKNPTSSSNISVSHVPIIYKKVADIKPPTQFTRQAAPTGSFDEWLQNISLKQDKRVFLFNGNLKKNQMAQFAVLDIPVGKKDLQQCADAVIRMRAEYLFGQHRFEEICFTDNVNKHQWNGGDNRAGFENYLEKVFSMCGTASLEKQLKPVNEIKQVMPGDVLIRGGYPGHAMMVIDVAVNYKGDKIYLLAQSYMPAQDIHIVRNPLNEKISPWYEADDLKDIITPEWKFNCHQLRRW